jgi:hypothetical protein
LIVPVTAAALAAACGGGGDSTGFPSTPDAAAPPASAGFGEQEGEQFSTLVVDPPAATIEVRGGATATQEFRVTGLTADGRSIPLTTGVTFGADNPNAGAIDGAGLYTANGNVGGLVTISARYKNASGTAKLSVRLKVAENPANAAPSVQNALRTASAPDTATQWAYPYDKTVFPRGLLAPVLMWNGSAPTDTYLVRISSPYFELESYATLPSPSGRARFAFDEATWTKFVESTSGNADVLVTRFSNNTATVVARHKWTIAPASMRGTVYYWSKKTGRVMRIKPGASKPDDFAFKPPLTDRAQFPAQSSCLMTCHSVSADGSTLVSGGGTFGGSYDLRTELPRRTLPGAWGGALADGTGVTDVRNVEWGVSAVYPDGRYLVRSTMMNRLGADHNGGQQPPLAAPPPYPGLVSTLDGSLVPNSGLEAATLGMPAFAPDGKSLAFVDVVYGVPGTNWQTPAPGPLRIYDFDDAATPKASNLRTLVEAGSTPGFNIISWPSISPDGNWVVYQRSSSTVTTLPAALFLASTKQPGVEIRLTNANAENVTTPYGARDPYNSAEPTFAPLAAGGYFWVVFSARRVYGNAFDTPAPPPATGTEAEQTLWVAAIDQNPTPGQDPSHPAFLLPGQDLGSLNTRGFWALDPCKEDGAGCGSGSECCGGYCDRSGGAPVCKSASSTCSPNGDRCEKTSDCCDAPKGATCINRVCSEAPPR